MRACVRSCVRACVRSISKNLTNEQQTELTAHLQQFVDTKKTANDNKSAEQASIKKSPTKLVESSLEKDKPYTQYKSLINWLKKLVEEFGLGLGWAAFYFSIFTAWWKGQTPGKKMMGMKVIKLDNTPLNLWESFGRYGGYAAGFATGLTGFMQVFWDPNRQAIQDKISETLVIDLRKPKVPFIKQTASLPHGK